MDHRIQTTWPTRIDAFHLRCHFPRKRHLVFECVETQHILSVLPSLHSSPHGCISLPCATVLVVCLLHAYRIEGTRLVGRGGYTKQLAWIGIADVWRKSLDSLWLRKKNWRVKLFQGNGEPERMLKQSKRSIFDEGGMKRFWNGLSINIKFGVPCWKSLT